jgi:hypothetical protein
LLRSLLICSFICLTLLNAASAQSVNQPSDTPDKDPKSLDLSKGKLGPFGVGGTLDGYYSFNDNHPNTGKNQDLNFDLAADSFDVNLAKVTLELTPAPIGFRVDAGFGRTLDVIHASSNSEPDAFRNIEQAYVSLKSASWHGFQVDFGKFLTSAGTEATETYLNWNYSRSLLFANGPYFHFGLRTSLPIGKHFSAGVQVLQGWNNIIDNNDGKTLGFTANVTSSKVTWNNTYLVGPEKTGTTAGYRNFYDTALTVTPSDKIAYYVNIDYVWERNPGSGSQKFGGIAVAGRYTLSKRVASASRLEWYNDADGFITGKRQQIKEFTLTGDYLWFSGLISRLEYRLDWSNHSFFNRGSDLAGAKAQSTVAIALIAFFGPKH